MQSIEKLQELRSRELSGDQKSSEWLMNRHDYITASAAASCAGLCGEATRMNILLEKASYGQYGHFAGGYYTDKGNIFESVTNAIYCRRNGTTIHEYGLIPHLAVPYLGASTDGVTDELVNIEIKTLASRELDGKIKKEYYHQTQLQMECLGLERTDFLEAKYLEMSESIFMSSYYDPAANIEQGIIMECWDIASESLVYIYSPNAIEMYTSLPDLLSWYKMTDQSLVASDSKVHIRDIYWRMTDYACTRIERDIYWAETYLPKLEEFWKAVENFRADQVALAKAISERERRKTSRRESRMGTSGLDTSSVCLI